VTFDIFYPIKLSLSLSLSLSLEYDSTEFANEEGMDLQFRISE